MQAAIGYLRVSTREQGRSGLGRSGCIIRQPARAGHRGTRCRCARAEVFGLNFCTIRPEIQ